MITSLRCQFVNHSDFTSLDSSIRNSLFMPSASVGCLDLTTLGQAVFAMSEICSGDDGLLEVKRNASISFKFRCSQVVPSAATIVTQQTRVVIELSNNITRDSNNIATQLRNLEAACPWLSAATLNSIKGHLRLCSSSSSSISFSLPRGLLITGPPSSGKKTLARELAKCVVVGESRSPVILDCLDLATLLVLHDGAVDVQTLTRNLIEKWMESKCLVLLNIDALDGGSVQRPSHAGASLSKMRSALPERARRIFLLELSAAMRRIDKSSNAGTITMWIATTTTASASSSSLPALGNWIATHIPLDTPEFSQRKALLEKKMLTELLENDETLFHRLLVATHQWPLGHLFDKNRLLRKVEELTTLTNDSKPSNEQHDDAAAVRIFGMDEDLQVIRDAVVAPLCRVARELREGLRSFASSSTTSVNTIALPKGLLCVGPSGCGKSHLLRHLAHQLISGSDGGVAVILQDTLSLVQKEVGATELNIHNLFERARASAPCVLLLDHIDSVAAPRSRQHLAADSSAQVADRMLSTLLVEMDGVASKASQRDKFVLVVATAPSLDCLDPAIRRPGRLDIHVHVRQPTIAAVIEMLLHKLRATIPAENSSSGGDAHATVCSFVCDHFGQNNGNDTTATMTVPASFADVESWCARKLTGLVSEAVKRGDIAAASPSLQFPSLEEWDVWLRS